MCFPDFCFSNRKACDLCSPENLSGDHRKHRGKCENSGFSPALQKDQFSLKISPKNEKTDQKTGRRRILKMVHSARFELTTYCSGGNRSIQLSYECAQYSTISLVRSFRNPSFCFFSVFFSLRPLTILRWRMRENLFLCISEGNG